MGNFTVTPTMGVGLGLSAVSLVAGYQSTLQSGQLKQSSLRGSAAQARQSAEYARIQATHDILAGQAQEQQLYMKGAQVKGAQLAALGASGVDMSSGTAIDQLTSTDVLNRIDVATTHDNAARSAWAARVQAQNLDQQARYNDWAASNMNPERDATMGAVSQIGQIALMLALA